MKSIEITLTRPLPSPTSFWNICKQIRKLIKVSYNSDRVEKDGLQTGNFKMMPKTAESKAAIESVKMNMKKVLSIVSEDESSSPTKKDIVPSKFKEYIKLLKFCTQMPSKSEETDHKMYVSVVKHIDSILVRKNLDRSQSSRKRSTAN